MLCKRFPFFNSTDDVEALIEIATIFGRIRMRACAYLHGCTFECTIPTVGERGFTLEKIVLWATNRITGGSTSHNQTTDEQNLMSRDEKMAIKFLARCLELDPYHRITADEALEDPFLRLEGEGEKGTKEGRTEEDGEEEKGEGTENDVEGDEEELETGDEEVETEG